MPTCKRICPCVMQDSLTRWILQYRWFLLSSFCACVFPVVHHIPLSGAYMFACCLVLVCQSLFPFVLCSILVLILPETSFLMESTCVELAGLGGRGVRPPHWIYDLHFAKEDAQGKEIFRRFHVHLLSLVPPPNACVSVRFRSISLSSTPPHPCCVSPCAAFDVVVDNLGDMITLPDLCTYLITVSLPCPVLL